MSSLPPTFKRARAKTPQSEDPKSSPPRERSWKSAFRFRKPTNRGNGELKNFSPEVGSADSKPDADAATSIEADSIWVRAEKKLTNDEKKKELFQAYLGILESQLGWKLKAGGTADRQKQLCQLLNDKTKELEDKKWKVRFGDHKVDVSDKLARAFQNVLIAKDLIISASSTSPPAAIACIGVTLLLTVSLALCKKALF